MFKPASESIFVAIPPPAPDPTITASYILEDSFICIVGYFENNIGQKNQFDKTIIPTTCSRL